MNYDSCLKCTERHLGCHSNCERYMRYRKHLDIIKEQKEKDRIIRLVPKRGRYNVK